MGILHSYEAPRRLDVRNHVHVIAGPLRLIRTVRPDELQRLSLSPLAAVPMHLGPQVTPLTLVFEQPLFKFAASLSRVEMNNSARPQFVSICGVVTGRGVAHV
jgi:hypothetical protein